MGYTAESIIAGGEQSYTGRGFNASLQGFYCRQIVINEDVTASGFLAQDINGDDITSEVVDTSSITRLKIGQLLTFRTPVYRVTASDGSMTFYGEGQTRELPDPYLGTTLAPYSLAFDARAAEQLADYEANTLYFRDSNFNRVGATFSRTTTATRVNKQGLIESVAANVPRIDYTDGSAKLLMEPSRTNLVKNSENFSGTEFTAALGTVSLNQAIAPNGELTADLFTKTSAVNTVSEIYSLGNYATTGVHTMSVFVKKNTGNSILLRLDRGGNTANAQFNFNTLTFTNSGANIISSSYVDYGDGWYRLIVTGNVLSTTWGVGWCNLFINPTNDSFYIWGAQLEEGNYPTSYIPTAGSTVTRNVDNVVIDNLQSSYIGSSYSLYTEADMSILGSQQNYFLLRNSSNSLLWYHRVRSTPTTTTSDYNQIDNEAMFITNMNDLNYKIAYTKINNQYKQIIDGGNANIYNSPSSLIEDKIQIISSAIGSGIIKAKQFILFPTALTDTELQQLTS